MISGNSPRGTKKYQYDPLTIFGSDMVSIYFCSPSQSIQFLPKKVETFLRREEQLMTPCCCIGLINVSYSVPGSLPNLFVLLFWTFLWDKRQVLSAPSKILLCYRSGITHKVQIKPPKCLGHSPEGVKYSREKEYLFHDQVRNFHKNWTLMLICNETKTYVERPYYDRIFPWRRNVSPWRPVPCVLVYNWSRKVKDRDHTHGNAWQRTNCTIWCHRKFCFSTEMSQPKFWWNPVVYCWANFPVCPIQLSPLCFVCSGCKIVLSHFRFGDSLCLSYKVIGCLWYHLLPLGWMYSFRALDKGKLGYDRHCFTILHQEVCYQWYFTFFGQNCTYFCPARLQ